MARVQTHALQVRRFGYVNWTGCASLMRRRFKSGFSDLHYTILGPVISNALYLLLFVIASSSLTTLDPEALVAFIAPGLISFTIAAPRVRSLRRQHHLREAPQHPCRLDDGAADGDGAGGVLCLSSTIGGMAIGGAVGLMTLLFVPAGIAHLWALLFFAVATGMMHGLIGTLLGI